MEQAGRPNTGAGETSAVSRLELVRDLLADDPRARGRVLDAGTGGGHMTAILVGFGPAELVSVSVDETSFTETRTRLPPGSEAPAGPVRFLLGDLSEEGLLPPGRFDLIVGDYLLASVAGHRPFRELDVLAGLRRLLTPGGLLILTGFEPLAPRRTREEELVWTVLRWWGAMTYLSGEEMYREVPAWWASDRLRERGFEPAEPFFSEPVRWTLGQLRRLAASAVDRAASSGDPKLAAFARARLGAFLREAARLPGFAAAGPGAAWSRDWVVRATPSTAGTGGTSGTGDTGETLGPGAVRKPGHEVSAPVE